MVAAGAAAQEPMTTPPPRPLAPPTYGPDLPFPRTFTGRQLTAIAFPLDGVCAGSISLEAAASFATGRFSTLQNRPCHSLCCELSSRMRNGRH